MENKTVITGQTVRQKFIDFFVNKHSHKLYKSSSLIPDNPTVMLTTAGMLQFVPIFLGLKKPEHTRAVSVQKCARAGGKDSDIENVGRTPRHHTFFEMLGNFSFGDYFKKEIIPWSWDFVTNELKLDKNRLWITVFETDDESFNIWKNDVGVSENRILRKGRKDNFWGPPGPTGPCGPCSEIHYDLGEKYSCGPNCSIDTCECDRYVEIWNLVFMELNKDEDGNYQPLERKNVDTGMGLERITMVMNELSSTFETDLLSPILEKVCEKSGKKYKNNAKDDLSIRIITDHARCVTFLVSDGLIPGNEGRNYVLRMILRRALRHGRLLGLELPFLYELSDTVIDIYKDAYPELLKNADKIKNVIKTEEERFKQTLNKGEASLSELISKVKSENGTVIAGEDAFKLYDTYGFPLELTIETAQENELSVDTEGFKDAMAEQKARAKNAHAKVSLTDNLVYADIYHKSGETNFIGYEATQVNDAKILKVVQDGNIVDTLEEDIEGDLILDRTPFYAESGGQTGDTGIIKNENFEAEVLNTLKFEGLIIHRVKVLYGFVKTTDTVEALVDGQRRKDIMIHHSSAHLLQSALKKVLGSELHQSGSQINPDRARFDYSFNRSLTSSEITQIENLINGWIDADLKGNVVETTPEEAKKIGATALFDEKYGNKVRVVSFGEISKELCGGTHAQSTGELRLCKIISESAVSAGNRRIEMICGKYALNYLNECEDNLSQLSKNLKLPMAEVPQRVEKLLEELKAEQKKVKTMEAEFAQAKVSSLVSQAKETPLGKVLFAKLDGVSFDALKPSVETLADKLGQSAVVLAVAGEDKVSIAAKISSNFNEKGIKAGDIVNKIAIMCDGRGGGNPSFAQAGGKNPAKLSEAIKQSEEELLKSI